MKNWLLGKPENALRQGYLWNMIASGINASEAIVTLMVAARTVGILESGVMAIAFTVANLMMCIGKYGVRNFQVTDTKNEYIFQDYFRSRIVTMLIMAAASVLFLAVSFTSRGYSVNKVLIVALVIGIYGVEAYEDVFLSALQHDGRLDIGTRMFSVRWFFTLLVWSLGLILTKKALPACAAALAVDFILMLFLTNLVKEEISTYGKQSTEKTAVKEIMIKCFPICVSAFLSIYLPNAAKYAIDSCLTDDYQAYYSFISMPVFVIDLLSVIIFQPLLVQLSADWNGKHFGKFFSVIGKLCVLILGLSIAVLLGGYLLGIPVLSLLYGVDLAAYKTEFMLLMAGGSALGYIGLFTSVLVIIRRQNYLMGSYLLVSLSAVFMLKQITLTYGIRGAAFANMMCLIILCLLLMAGSIFFIIREYRKNDTK